LHYQKNYFSKEILTTKYLKCLKYYLVELQIDLFIYNLVLKQLQIALNHFFLDIATWHKRMLFSWFFITSVGFIYELKIISFYY